MGHDHKHSTKNLRLAFFLNLCFTILEVIGGMYTNSVAIISDAVHDLGDTMALGLAWFLQSKSGQEANEEYTYGYGRYSLLGAFITGFILISGAVFVIREAILRIITPEVSDAKGMILFALLGIAVNGYAAWKLSKGKSMNERLVSWHLWEDVLGWVAILVASIVLLFVESPYIDPILSLLITLYILWNVFKRLRETILLFLQRIPSDVNVQSIKNDLLNIEGVASLHHTHIWSLDGEKHVFSSHVLVENVHSIEEFTAVKSRINTYLKKYKFQHINIQIELPHEDSSVNF